MKVAGIVVYHPEEKRLEKNIEKILPQVDKVIIVFNSILNLENSNEKIIKIYNEKNKGIAFALNQIVEQATVLGAEWCLTLDQDSIVPENIIYEYENKIDKNIAILCPNIINLNSHRNRKEYEDKMVKLCITSGSYINIKICNELGKFNENFFIDYVDWEYCARVKRSKYLCKQIGSVCLEHQLGNVSYHNLFGLEIQTYNHNAFRKYYITRNTFLINRMYPEFKEFKHPMLKTIKRIIIVIFYEDDKLNKVRSMLRGIRVAVQLK